MAVPMATPEPALWPGWLKREPGTEGKGPGKAQLLRSLPRPHAFRTTFPSVSCGGGGVGGGSPLRLDYVSHRALRPGRRFPQLLGAAPSPSDSTSRGRPRRGGPRAGAGTGRRAARGWGGRRRRLPEPAGAAASAMPLLVEGRRVRLPQSAADLVRAHPFLEERARLLRGQSVQQVGPQGLLYVQQRELAVTSPKDGSISILGSDDATTCHIVVLRHTGNGATCLTHCDGTDTKAEVPLIVNSIKSFSDHTQCGR
ncbi:uncharacterized protein LOC130861056 [Hippopotamus amphibius kiboko]|uniref:uncharacterized protein LOC130861056 n=1 Tax=Hippopotamus amphibius kiboko TaxID=575201 RepID=UPI0025926E7B|nr:uncharacterized protein LOC130861056 [Hippopotamus amphibius kiboko]